MSSTIVARLDHRLAPMDAPAVATGIADVLTRPCFRALPRVWINVKGRDKKHVATSAGAVRTYFLDPESHDVLLDSGRKGELVASARLCTGRHILGFPDPKPLLASYVVVPYLPDGYEEVMAGFLELARVLEVVAGYVTLEPNHSRAHRTALCKPPRHADFPDYSRLRAKERKAHFKYKRKLDTELAGPDWGMFLSTKHLERLSPTRAIWAQFVQVKDLSDSLVFMQLSPDPRDVFTPEFDEVLKRARQIFAPILMDVSGVPVEWD